MLRIPIARLPMGLVPRWQRWRSCLQVSPRSWRSCLQVSSRPLVESPTCFRVNRVVIFFVALKIVVLFAVLFVDCEECPVFFLGPCQVLDTQSFAFSFRLSKVEPLIEWLLSSSSCIHRENPMLRILSSLSSFCGVHVLLHNDSVVQLNVVFFPHYGWQRLSVLFVGVPSWKYRWMASVFSCGAFLSMSRPVLQLLSFRRSVLLSTTAVFLDHISRDWGDVTVVQFELCWTPRTLHISSTTAIEYSNFPLGIAVWTSVLFKDLGVVQAGDQVLRFFAELVDLLRLNEWFLMFVVLELLDQPFDFVLACCILRFDCRKVL